MHERPDIKKGDLQTHLKGAIEGSKMVLNNIILLIFGIEKWEGIKNKYLEQIPMPRNKIKFIEKSMKHDTGAKLRVILTL